ncbi:hypothetical protein EH228_07970 [Erwinia endophytica]|uniref:hypothetical protein n=1 Tax=Erwinia endophytica TaxID=1563158 RepID=UPI001265E4B3|nr:hypothetical protein [Erwinia endophytica]KAB8312453.1 hypothetical protein EH228_07970 [Erwinia endophytica]
MKKYLMPVILTMLWSAHAFCATIESSGKGTTTVPSAYTYPEPNSTNGSLMLKCTVLNGGQSNGITFNDNGGSFDNIISTDSWDCNGTWHHSNISIPSCSNQLQYAFPLIGFNDTDNKVDVQYSAACGDSTTVEGVVVLVSDISLNPRASCGADYEPELDFGTVSTNGEPVKKVLVSNTTGNGRLSITSAGHLDGTPITMKSGENEWTIDAVQDGTVLSMDEGDNGNSNAALGPITLRTHTAPDKPGKYQGTAVLTVVCE